MFQSDRRTPWLFALLFLIVVLSRVPFLDAGYGLHADGWRVAKVARELAQTGQYDVSRLPGYPVQEIGCALVWWGGPLALNGLSAILSAVCVTVFASLARRLGCKDWFLAGLALAFTPIFFLSSVMTKDFVWALTFVLVSFAAMLRRQPAVAGILLGVAFGCRITSLAMALPLTMILWWQTDRGQRMKMACRFAAITTLSALLFFSPVLWKYGVHFFTYYEHPRPDWQTALLRGTVGVWGNIGLLGLALAGSFAAWHRFRRRIGEEPQVSTGARGLRIILGMIVLIYTAAFVQLPDQAEYLLPVIPAVLLFVARFLPRVAFVSLAAALLVAPWVEVNSKGFAQGALVADRRERLAMIRNITAFLGFSKTVAGSNVFVVGGWEPQINFMEPQASERTTRYVYLLSPDELVKAMRAGERIWYLPLMREFTMRVHHYDLAKCGALDAHAFFKKVGVTPSAQAGSAIP